MIETDEIVYDKCRHMNLTQCTSISKVESL